MQLALMKRIDEALDAGAMEDLDEALAEAQPIDPGARACGCCGCEETR